ncbi:usg protein [Nitrospirillum sp. BR 11828]|uniref:usg protein n=1 Tax=Nitrospirillum sp. BR 11828 TaxID=3104325 RepID=UPI003A0FFCD7
MTDLEKQLLGWRLTTAEIVYRMPDHPGLLQAYVWQELDMAPRFPQLRRFLDFWETRLDGRIHRVQVVSAALVRPAEIRHGHDAGWLH